VSFLSDFIGEARARALFPHSHNPVVVACSGGLDSLFLLHLLWASREPLGLDLSVLTCDHGLRPESAEEVHEVRHLAWCLGLPCQVRRLRMTENRRPGESVEMTARRLRRQAYREAAEDFGADAVALGHHLDDQAETLLLRLCRGTGTRGAAGMEWIAPLGGGVRLLRPLLGMRRMEIARQADAWGLKALEDPSNRNRAHHRNRVRHEVIPLLERRLNPEAVRHLAEFMAQLRKLDDWAAAEARTVGPDCLEGEGLRLTPWRGLPEVLRERLLWGWLTARGAEVGDIHRSAFTQWISELHQPVPHARRWRVGGLWVRVDGEVLTVDTAPSVAEVLTLSADCELEWSPLGRRIRAEWVRERNDPASGRRNWRGELTAHIRLPAPGEELQVRSPRRGDRYRPLGLAGSVKLSDLFINQRIPARLRPRWPVFVCGDAIVWVPGGQVAADWKVGEAPCLALRLLTPAATQPSAEPDAISD
jgi:tRNA(Ile)-lysidine synthase